MNRLTSFLQYTGLVLLIFSLPSCKKFLDVAPKNFAADDITITDKKSAETAVRGAYNALSSDNYYGTTFQAIGYLSGGDLNYVGSVVTYDHFIRHTVRPDNATLTSVWSAIYRTINFANHVIAKLPLVEDQSLTQAQRDQLTGEAYFIRALSYFDLARTWGGVQIVLTPTATFADRAGISRSTVQQTYAQVLSDLEKAETLLPATINRVRATKNTVAALRARYHLYREEWAQAETYSTQLIDNNANYTLIAPYNSWFAGNVVATKESIFELSYSQSSNPNSHRTSWQPAINKGTMSWGPNNTLVSLLNTPETGGNRNKLIAQVPNSLWYGNLYYRLTLNDPSYILRIAEQYLIRAEARVHLDDLSGALEDLNAVRVRAELVPFEYVDGVTTAEEILLAIENERRLEFAFEPHRWFDLVRTHRVAETLGVTDEYRSLLPIPFTELQADAALEQNEGYK